MRSRWQVLENPFIAGTALVMLACLAYLRLPSSPFQYDDHYAVVDVIPFLDFRGLLHTWQGFPFGRPLTQTLLAFDAWRASTVSSRDFHETNFVLHLIVAALVYRLALCLLAGRAEARLAAALAALIFALHPLQAQAADYVINRSSILATIGTLGCILAMLRAAEGSLGWMVLAAFSWLLGMAGKETASTAPVLALACLVLRPPAGRRWKTLTWLLLLPVLATAACFGPSLLAYTNPASSGPDLKTQAWVIPNYLRLTFFPWLLSVTHHFPDIGSWKDPRLPLTLTAWTGMALAAWLLRHRPLALWAGFWWLVALLPESSFIPLEDRMMDHRPYLALAGPAVAAGLGLAWMIGRFPPVRAGSVALVGLLVLGTMSRGVVWAEPRLLWAEACRVSPRSPKVWTNFGQMEHADNRLQAAVNWTVRAIDLRPGDVEALMNLGVLQAELNNPEAAQGIWESLPGYAPAQFRLGCRYQELKRLDDAEQAYQRAVLYSQRKDLKSLNALGALLAQRGEPARARLLFEEVLSRNPGDGSAMMNLGMVLEDLGFPDEGREKLEDACRRAPEDPVANLALGKCYQAEADQAWATVPHPGEGAYQPDALLKSLEAALKEKPDDPDRRQALLCVRQVVRRWDQALTAYQFVLAFPPSKDRLLMQSRDRLMSEALEHMAAIATARGHLQQGCALLGQALVLDPGNQRIQAFLAANPLPSPPPPAPPEKPFLPSDLKVLSGPAPAPAAR